MKILRAPIAVAATLLLWTAASSAAPDDNAGEEGGQCLLHRELTPERHLRRLSMDLRGRVPAYEDYALVEGETSMPEAVVDAFLADDGFRVTMRRYHELLLWPNPYGVNLITQNFTLSSFLVGSDRYYFIPSTTKKRTFRGGDGSHTCQPVHQDTLGWNADGTPVCEPTGTDATGPWCQEGYVEVLPYWETDPTAKLRVCAFGAQEAQTYDKNGQTLACNQRLAGNEKACGCGPDLRFCLQYTSQRDVWAAWREQFLRLVDDYTDGSRPYSEMLTTKRGYTNGKLEFHRKYLAAQTNYARAYTQPGQGDQPIAEDPDWHDVSWTEITREAPHSGVLTLPAYSLRFQTNRGRANRFRIAFTGQYFQPPNPEMSGCESEGDDLTTRCTCRKCHAVLEPLAAYFGSIAEAGSTPLAGFAKEFSSQGACNAGDVEPNGSYCNRFYKVVRDPVDPDIRRWKLLALEWADASHPEVIANYDAGPAGIVADAKNSGILYRATTMNMFKFLLKREMNMSPTAADSEVDLLDEISAEFQSHDDLARLVKRIVQLPQYRRMP